MAVYCRICGAPGAACGDSHQTLPLLDVSPFTREDRKMTEPQEPQKLQEYQYRVGHMVTTAMLTEDMAERMGAVPLGEELPDDEENKNKESERLSSENAAALKGGVDGPDGDVTPKSRTARNKRSEG